MANAVTTFLDDHVAAGHGGRTAILAPDRRYTYGEVLAASSRAGNALRKLGIEREERVALILPDGIEFAAMFFGALRIGAIAVLLNPRLPPDDLAELVRDSGAAALIGDPVTLHSLRGVLAGAPAPCGVLATGTAPGFPSLSAALSEAASELVPETVADDAMACWLYTSGTTGRPKAAVHLHRHLLAGDRYGREVLGIASADRVFATSKLFFAYALGNALLLPLAAGAEIYLHPDWPDLDAVAAILRDFRPTLFFSVPTFFARLLRVGLPPDAFGSTRLCVSAGERLPPQIYRSWRDRFGAEILDGMGATETIFMVLSNPPGQSRAGSCGMPVPGAQVRLLDTDDREVPAGAQGVLHVRAPSTSPMYWNRPDESRRAFRDGWFRTGDVYYRDHDGFFYHCGRADEFFKVAGMWVVPADIEAVLCEHPDVLEAGVVGAEAENGLVKPFAFVVPRSSAPADLVDQLASHATARLSPHQRPRRILSVTELPRTTTGKLQRGKLREQCAKPPPC
jgi:benzoate-CoA ligase family protein